MRRPQEDSQNVVGEKRKSVDSEATEGNAEEGESAPKKAAKVEEVPIEEMSVTDFIAAFGVRDEVLAKSQLAEFKDGET